MPTLQPLSTPVTHFVLHLVAARRRWEALMREERQLLFSCSEGGDSALAQLCELCSVAAQPGAVLDLSDVLRLALVAYCVLPDSQPW